MGGSGDTTDAQPLGSWLRQRRKALDLTQDSLAERVGCSRASIQMIEQGQRKPSRQVAELLAEALLIPEAERDAFLARARGMVPGMVPAPEDGVVAPDTTTTRVQQPPSIPHNLPAQLTALIGRDEEVAAVEGMLRGGARLITLTGPPGVGKTRLAIEVGATLGTGGGKRESVEGVFWVPLSAVTDPAMVVPSIARVLGIESVGTQTMTETLTLFLRHKKILLLLDNFEQVIEAGADMADLLAECPGIALLVTSREALSLRGERGFDVSPLPFPDQSDASLEMLAQSPSVALFVERAYAADRSFSLTLKNAHDVSAICAELEGLPLAIELVAARTKMVPLHALLARLQETHGQPLLSLSSGGARDHTGRHKTLRDAIGWSYSLLEGDEQTLLRRLGVFLGGFTLPAAEAVCNPDGALNIDLFEGVSQLLHKSLLKREITQDEEPGETEGDGRFSMLETIREYALERLRESGEEEALRLLHAEYFLGMATRLDLTAVGESENVLYRQLDRNHDNLRGALTWSIENRRMDLAAQFGASLPRYWELRGHYSEGRDWVVRILSALSLSAKLDAEARAKRVTLLMWVGRLSLYLSDYSTARSSLEDCLVAASEEDLDEWSSHARFHVGLVTWMQGDYTAARRLLADYLITRQASGNKVSIAAALWILGNVAGECGEFENAESLLREAVALGREAADMYTVCGSTRDLGAALCYAGKYREAMHLLEEAFSLAQSAKFKVGTDWTLCAMGQALLGLAKYSRAAEQFKASLTLARKLDKHRIADCLEGLAEVELRQSNADGSGCEKSEGYTERAAVLLGAAERVRRILHMLIIPVRAPVRERLIAEAQVRLDAAKYERAYGIGYGMSLDEAISAGLDQLPEISR
ncbi:MAG: helix-turn-helix domain-containing protein [Chloroflexota bacterium]|nr:helix-turn-helix domain-containing protein [Chloroflexota bacterium]